MEPQQTSKAFVVNVLHDGDDGQNSVMLDLDNENDSFLYDGNGNRISDAVTSQATLFDGYDMVLSGITWIISQASGVELINGGAATDTAPDISLHPTAAWITSGGVVTVYGMSSQVVSGLVKVCATYNGNSYYKELTLKRIVNGDKYTLVISPSSIPYNPNETYESQTITASATRLTAEGKTYDVTFNSGGMYLAAYYKPNASDPAAWYQCSGTLSVTEAIAQNNSNIRFELRRAKAGQVYDKDLPATYAVEDFETIPIPRDGKDGKNSIRLTLDNEHEDFLYSDSGTSPIAPALGATSQARLYDGETEVLAANVGWSISASSGVVTNDSSSPYYASVSNGLLTVKGINADTAYVTVRAKYPNTDDGKYYYAKFTANKTSQDKYDLIVRPNAISYNSATYPQAGTIIELSSKRTDLQGQQTNVTIRASQTIAAGYVYVFYGFVKADGTVVKPSNPNVAGVENLGATSRVISASEASTYSGIYLELRKYTDTTNYRLCDYETVEIAKAENGPAGNGIVSITKTYGISASGTTESDAYPPSDITSWSAGSPAVTEAKPYLWAKEETVYTDTTRNTTKYYCIGRRGDNGVDAKDLEFAYIRTKTNQAPEIYSDNNYTDSNNKTYTSDDHLPRVNGSNRNDIEKNEGTSTYPECTDDPKGVDDEYKYEWEIKRTKGPANGVTGARSWQYYSGTMTLHNNFAESAFIIDLDNDNDQFGTDSESKVLVEQVRSTTVTIYDGSTPQTLASLGVALKYDDGTDVPTTGANAVATYTANTSTGVVAVTILQNTTTAFSHSEIKAFITASVTGKGSKNAVFTIRKVMSGQPGLSPTIYQLNPTNKSFVFNRDASNNLTPGSRSTIVNALKTYENQTTDATSADNLTFTWGFDEGSQEGSGAVGDSSGNPPHNEISISNTQANAHYQVWIQLSSGDRETLPIVKDGTNGDKGDPAVVYIIEPSPDSVNFHSNTVGDFSGTQTVNVTIKKTVGNAEPQTISRSSEGTYDGYYLYFRQVKSTSTSWFANSGSINVDVADVLSDNITGAEFALSSASSAANVTSSNIIRSKTVSIILDGRRGVQGATGKMFYLLGEWEAKSYSRTEMMVPMVHYDDGEFSEATGRGNYYYLNADSASSDDIPGTSSKWVKAANFGVVITQGLFAEFAKLGKAIMSGDYMFSSEGRVDGEDMTLSSKWKNITSYTMFCGDPSAKAYSNIFCGLSLYTEYYPTYASRGTIGQLSLISEEFVVLKIRIEEVMNSNSTAYMAVYNGSGTQITIQYWSDYYSDWRNANELTVHDTTTYYIRFTASSTGTYRVKVKASDSSTSLYGVLTRLMFEPTWWTDLRTGKNSAAKGNFVAASDYVKIDNLYRNAAIVLGGSYGLSTRVLNPGGTTTTWLYIKSTSHQSDSSRLAALFGFSVGDYFEYTQAMRESYDVAFDNCMNRSWDTADFVVCTYNSDNVTFINAASGTNIVNLPCAKDYVGKMVEVFNATESSLNVYAADHLYIGILRLGEKGNLYFDYNNAYTSWVVSSNNTVKFYSVGQHWVVFSFSS